MGTYTNNLNLYKPSKNEYYNIDKDQNDNFDKIDEKFGAVDVGLKNKVSKSGDTMTGKLTLKTTNFSPHTTIEYNIDTSKVNAGWIYDNTVWNVNGTQVFKQGIVGKNLNTDYIYWGNNYDDNMLRLYLDGKVKLKANNLKTNAKEVIEAINELADGKENVFEKKSGFNLDKTDSYNEGNSDRLFTQKGANDLKREIDGKVSKSGDTITGKVIVKSDIDISRDDNDDPRIYVSGYNGKRGVFYRNNSCVGIGNHISNKYFNMNDDGTVILPSVDLKTSSKNVVGGINEIAESYYNKNTGGQIDGPVTIKTDYADCLNIYADGSAALRIRDKSGNSYKCMVGCSGEDVILWHGKSDTSIRLKPDGSAYYPANNLKTSNKEVVQAVNSIYEKFSRVLINYDGGKQIVKTGDTMVLSKAIDPNYQFVYLYFMETNTWNRSFPVRVSTQFLLNGYTFGIYSHDGFRYYKLVDRTTIKIVTARDEGDEQNCLYYVEQRDI